MKEKILIFAFTLLAILPCYIHTVPLEAAFQGQCEDGAPCEHSCFNLHDTMYECYCYDGFYLHSNGYNCIAFNSSNSMDSEEPVDTPGNISIQIEVDIEPPEESEGEHLSHDQLERLGLPSKHVHFTAASAAGAAAGNSDNKAELLQPADIQVSYADTDNDMATRQHNPNTIVTKYQDFDESVDIPELEWEDEVDPPLALPVTAEGQPDLLPDNIYHVDMYCGLECGEGECKILETGVKRCLCPVGWGGDSCRDMVMVSGVPRLSGYSHLTLPTLQNAYSDLHMSLDFKPESWTGVILITGQTEDMTGDYLALILNDGYVELRLDCGTGPGLVRSSSQVMLNTWNHVSVFRHDWAVWIQLNGGHKEEGRSQGLFSRITFNQPLFVGGVGEMRNVKNFLGVDSGLVGCVRRLEINDKYYNLAASMHGGDIVAGKDISSCEASGTCEMTSCGHGHCQIHYKEPVCECSLGFSGDFCQDAQEIKVAKFAGSSYIRYPGLGDSALLWLQIEIIFKPEAKDGILLYNGDRNDGQGDFMSIVMDDGFIVFLMDLGSGVGISRSVERVELGTWHNVTVLRSATEVTLNVDQQLVTVSRVGTGQLSLGQELWLGGVSDMMSLPATLSSNILTGYQGCVASLTINSLPVQLQFSASTSVRVTSCGQETTPETKVTRPTVSQHSAPAFSGRSYLAFNNSEIYSNLIGNTNLFNLRLKMTSSDAIIIWAGGHNMDIDNDFIMLQVEDGIVQFSFNLGSGFVQLEYNDTRIDDGLWHRIRATRVDQTASLLVDNGETVTARAPGYLTQLNILPTLYLGGLPDTIIDATSYYTGMVGCVSDLSVGNIASIDMLAQADKGRNVDTCEK